ncbi:hypothetical protein BVX98_03780 [bacterium F11]|nr:hypothetical protein BVX98_03780 [bacterium F11]
MTTASLLLPPAQNVVHGNAGKTYYFSEPLDQSTQIGFVTFPIGVEQVNFTFYTEMASYPTGEDGRTGTWEVRAEAAPLLPAVHQLIVNPGPTARIGVDNPKITLEAGKITHQGVLQPFEFELWDALENPIITTETVRIIFTSTRTPSTTNDSFGFTLSSYPAVLPGVAANTTSYVEIASGSYAATFYYFDTRSSELYGALSSSRPVIGGTAQNNPWVTSDHYVEILPTWGPDNKIVVISSAITFVAGTTTTARQFQLQDNYDNPTSIFLGVEDVVGQGMAFDLVSTSTGDYAFSSPDSTSFTVGPSVAKLAIGEHTTTYYLTDNLAGTHTLTIDESLDRGFEMAIQTYTIVAAPPSHLVFTTPVRKLIAGTTISYEVGVTTPNIRIETRDRYNNVAPVLATDVIDIFSDSPLGEASVTPNDSGSFQTIFGVNALSLTFTIGTSARDFFYRDEIVGFPNLSAVDQSVDLIGATTYAVVTPNKTDHFSLHHPFDISTPLSVRNEGVIDVVARDIFDNPADGGASLGEDNGFAYSGTISIAHTGSTNYVTISGDGVGISSLTFVATSTGSFTLRDLIQETLELRVTDYANNLYGQTGVPPSNGSVVTTGLVVTPADMAPEPFGPGRSTFKDSILVAENLAQGDGNTLDSPDPVPMLRVRTEVKPSGVGTSSTWKGLRIRKVGSIPNSEVTELALWIDMGFKDGIFDISSDGNGSLPGTPISTCTFANVGGSDICDFDFTSDPQTITNVFQHYFVTVRISTTAPEGSSFGLEVQDSSDFTIPAIESTARIAENNFPMNTYASNVIKTPAPVMLEADDIAAFYDNVQHLTAPQGHTSVGFLRLGFWTREFTGILDKIKVTRIGTGSDLDVDNLRVYLDGLDGTDGDGSFQTGADTLIDSTIVQFSTSAAEFNLNPNVLIDGTTKYLFVVMSVADSALIGSSLGVRIPARTDIILADGIMVDYMQDPSTQSFPILSSQPQIVATNDELNINPYPAAPAAATQGDASVPVVRLEMNSNDHSVILQGIRINRKNANQVNEAEDVSNIRIFYDVDGDTELNPTIDQIVSPLGDPIVFQSTLLDNDISNLATNIPVVSVADFPTAPGRLVIEDNTGNREVVLYSGVDAVFNEFTGVTRGAEGTVPVPHLATSKVDGQAYIPVLGAFDGQEILRNKEYKPQTVLTSDLGLSTGPISIGLGDTTELPPTGIIQIGSEFGIAYASKTATTVEGAVRLAPEIHGTGEVVFGQGRNKSFFITFDIDPLATPGRLAGKQTILGLDIPATSYVVVGSPDIVGPIPSFNAEIGDIVEFGDEVVVTSTETTHGLTLQQGTDNNPVLTIFMETELSEAFWNRLIVTSTGTGLPSDVELVKLWYDQDNNGLFSPALDLEVSSGTFGNAGDPFEARLRFTNREQLLVTPYRSLSENISRRWWITYDMEDLATPETTLATEVKVPADFSLTLTPPNFDQMMPDNLPYTSKLRTIIPSPRIVTVISSPIVSNQLGTFDVPVLDVPLGAIDTEIRLRPNTLMLPATGYVVIQSEVIYYGGKSPGALQNVQRGQLGSFAEAHPADVVVGSYYTQGEDNLGLLKLLVSCDGFQVRWFDLKLNRFLPPGSIKGNDNDITTIKVWRDNGNGTLDRDPATGTIPLGTEILVGQKPLGQGEDTGGSALIGLDDPSVGSPGFAVITAQQTTYWVTIDVDPTALYDDLVGLEIGSPTSLVIGALTENDDIHSVSRTGLPTKSAAFVIRPTLDEMEIELENMAPPDVFQAQQNIPMIRIFAKTNSNTAVWDRLRVDLYSDNGAVNGDVSSIKLFRDAGDDSYFTSDETSQTAKGSYINMISQGTENFTDGSTELLLEPQIIDTDGQYFFLAYDINALAQVAVNVGALIHSATYFNINFPDSGTFAIGVTEPYISGRSSIKEAIDIVTLGVDDIAKDLANQGGTYQASVNVPMLRFTLTTDISQAYWSAIRLERTGTSAQPEFPFGHNSDVKYVKIWRDINFNDVLDASDELLSGSTVSFNLSDDNDRIINIPLNSPILVSNRARSYFVSYDVGEGAEAEASLGVRIGDLSWITVSDPNLVSPDIRIIGSLEERSYPFETTPVPINAIQVAIAGQSLSPAQIPQASTGVPVMRFNMSTDRNFVTLRTIKFTQTGTIDVHPEGNGDVAKVSLWMDNGNEVFEPSIDSLLGESLHGATTDFVNGSALVHVNGSSGTIITMSPSLFFVSVDVGDLNIYGDSVKGHRFGIKINDFPDIGFIPATAGSHVSNDFASLLSNQTYILDQVAAIVPPVIVTPKIWADPYGDGFPSMDDGTGNPMPRQFGALNVPIIDIDGDGISDLIQDLATERWGVDIDGDGLIEVDMTRNGVLDVDFNNDGKPDEAIPDQNGDSIPEIDLSKDGYPEYGYIPEKWTKDTSRIFSKWGRVTTPLLDEYQVGLGVNNMSNNITDDLVPDGWFSTGKNNEYELSNLTLLAARVTKLAQSVPIERNPPFDLYVDDGAGFIQENGQINVGSEIMGYSLRVGNIFTVNKRGEDYGTPRHEHFLNEKVTNEGYVLRARAVTSGSVYGAETALKVIRVDVSPPNVPGTPVSDQELAGGEPSTSGVYSIKWSPSSDLESGVRAYEIQERVDNDPVWRTIRLVPSTQLSFLVGNNDNPANPPKEPGHFYTYRVRSVNQAGGISDWSPESEAASTGFPEEVITELTNYPNPVDTRQGPTNISYILNEDSTVNIQIFDLLGYLVRQWEFDAGQSGAKVGPNVLQWDGTDNSGGRASAGGYIMRIEVIGSKGSTVVIRKIGIIH